MAETINQIADRFCASMKSCKECSFGMGLQLGVDRCLIKQLSMLSYPFESITDFLKKWAAANPAVKRKTYADDFLEKHPNAAVRKASSGEYPAACRAEVYGVPYHGRRFLCDMNCRMCWRAPMPDNRKDESSES